MAKRKTEPIVPIKLSVWVALTEALNASPDIEPNDLVTKAKRLVESRGDYARQVVDLETRLLKKRPDLEK